MVKFIILLFIKIIFFFDKILKKLKKGSIADFIFNNLKTNLYKKTSLIKIGNKKIKLISSNPILKFRSETFFTKEPETLNWINSFGNNFNSFWDIGANVGLYSLYVATKYKNKEIVCFEPSMNNLKILSENISINNLQNCIKLVPFGLGNKKNFFYMMNESSDQEGGANNSLGDNINYKGISFNPIKQYKVFGTTVDEIIKSKILETPNYIKIDVDGFEHLILEGSKSLISSNQVKSILIEINEKYTEHFNKIMNIMISNNFVIKSKYEIDKKEKLSNFIFVKKKI